MYSIISLLMIFASSFFQSALCAYGWNTFFVKQFGVSEMGIGMMYCILAIISVARLKCKDPIELYKKYKDQSTTKEQNIATQKGIIIQMVQNCFVYIYVFVILWVFANFIL